MVTFDSTIAAISTAMAPAGIGIVRLSGQGARSVADRCFFGGISLMEAASHTVHYGHVMDGDEVVDEVLVSVFLSPNSYTGEDVVEISAHGGVYVLKKILDVVLQQGAVLAGPGEFTKRRFLNGKMDLAQAESVMDIISAENHTILSSGQAQLSGILSGQLKGLRDEILHETSFIEAALDDPEHYDLEGYSSRLYTSVDKWKQKIDDFVDSSLEGVMLRDGIKTVILGPPNAGKSSLLNALARMDRAIVSDLPGTTRDTLEEKVSMGDFSLRIIDTAGIRSEADDIEKLGIDRALAEADSADLILLMVDGSVDISKEFEDILWKLRDTRANVITIINKSDIGSAVDENDEHFSNSGSVVSISAKTGDGLDTLKQHISDLFFSGDLRDHSNVMITNLRHKSCLMEASSALDHVMGSIHSGMPEDFFTLDLMDAYTSLGKILGESVEDDLVDRIFSEFCMGK